MGKIAILLVGAVLAASAQCIADCGILPCDESAVRQTAPVEECHHQHSPEQAPQPDHEHTSNCGHQLFVSEAGPQAVSVHVDFGVVAVLEINLIEPLPTTPALGGTESDRSPPPSLASASRTILRV